MKRILVLLNDNLSYDATDFYLKMILDASLKAGFSSGFISSLSEIEDGDILVTVDAKDFFRAFVYKIISGKKIEIINWFQGVVPEEAYLVFNSKFRKFYWECFERLALKYSLFNIFVSKSMLSHYNEKYGYYNNNHIIIPCFNCSEFIFKNEPKEKKLENKFLYAGSLADWQLFDKTIDVYNEISMVVNNTSLLILTSEIDKAKKILSDKSVLNFEVDYVSYDGISEAIKSCKFGFVLRDDIAVNKVATPTKINTYISSGVIPIISPCIGDFKEMFGGYPVVFWDESEPLENNIDKVNHWIEDASDEEVYSGLSKIIERFYNRDSYISSLSKVFHEWL